MYKMAIGESPVEGKMSVGGVNLRKGEKDGENPLLGGTVRSG